MRLSAHGITSGAAAAGDRGNLVISLVNADKTYGAIRALRSVSLEVRGGEILGLCGHNGAGKSTLVKLLCGVQPLDSGRMTVMGKEVHLGSPREGQALGIALVDQELSILPSLTVDENLLLGAISEPFINRRRASAALLQRVGLKVPDPRVAAYTLTLAERQLLEIARGLARGSRLLILDEPTATLSDNEIERVFAAVRAAAADGCAILFVSHRLGEVLELCERVVVMRDGQVVADRPSAGLVRPQLVELMVGDAVSAVDRAPQGGRGRTETPSMTVVGLAVPGALLPLDLSLHPGQVLALAGQVGSGAGTLLRALAGLEPAAQGSISVASATIPLGSPQRAAAVGVAYVSNDRKGEGLFLDQSVQLNLLATRLGRLARGGVVAPGRNRKTAADLAKDAHIDVARLSSDVEHLSGGNQQKVLIGRCLNDDHVKVLLLDEPSRGVDVKGRAEIHRLIRAAAAEGLAVLFASTELDELLELSDEILTMRAGRIIARHSADATTGAAVLADMTHAEAA